MAIVTQRVPVSLNFFVAGKPQTAGSKTAIPGQRHDGSLYANVVDGGKKHVRNAKKSWRADLRAAAEKAISDGDGWEMPGPKMALALTIVIVRARPSGHVGTGRNEGIVKDHFLNAQPVERPDTIKLVRAAEDALTKVVWNDDSQVVEHHLYKVFGDQAGLSPFAEGMRVVVREALPALPEDGMAMNESSPFAGLPEGAVAVVRVSDSQGAYRGKLGCKDVTCTRDGNPERCFGWHCIYCDGPSNCQGDCSCRPDRSTNDER